MSSQRVSHFYTLGIVLAASLSHILLFSVAQAEEKITLKCMGDLMIWGKEYADDEFAVMIDLAQKQVRFDNANYEIRNMEGEEITFGTPYEPAININAEGKINRVTGQTSFYMWHGSRPVEVKKYIRINLAKCAKASSLF
jgi:hypothetical protein